MYYLRKTHIQKTSIYTKKSFREPNAGHLVWKVVGPGTEYQWCIKKQKNGESNGGSHHRAWSVYPQ